MSDESALMVIAAEIKDAKKELHEIRNELFIFRKKLVDTIRELKYDNIKRNE